MNNIKQPIKDYLTGKRGLPDLESYLFNLEVLESPNADNVCLAISFAIGVRAAKLQKNNEMFKYFLDKLKQLLDQEAMTNEKSVEKMFNS